MGNDVLIPFGVFFLKTCPADPIRVEMIVLVTGFLTYAQATVAVVSAMVVLAVATALLETHTPAPRRRSTRLAMPRRVEGPLESLPERDPRSVRFDYDRRLAAQLAPRPMVLVRPGVDGPEPVTSPKPDPGPPTEEVPTVVVPVWATQETIAPPARTAIRRAVAHRMAPPVPWDAASFEPAFIDHGVLGPSVEREAALEAAMGLLAAPVEPTPSRSAAASTIFVARVEVPGGSAVELGDPGVERDLAGVLFAAYVSRGMPERNRVTGWVAAAGTAPSLAELGPEERLRGRPGKVRALLECRDDERNWVTLDSRTDITRGLSRRPPEDEVLKGILWWWFMATDERARVPAEHVAALRSGLESVLPAMHGHALASTVEDLVVACSLAESAGAGIRIESVSASRSGRRRARPVLHAGDGTPSSMPVAV